ncbi:CheC, inhibitor of MCP methylation [Alkaliphilus metalliredigens QYMF]|uniref:CheC, inhibitor of MCP methylation n=1 Tax=Alkaliphilus metalliredigens (strain QYMF) TaxID=293826 RepID=A6TRP4_ALKMQ|nr:flagellar motor switch phosphatase FliY [Alkaliphilus metalliredigens]ABR48862.1 CheC, inhibitor of MCP methylation [Alkaliphilus metalliredigens QYMF]
MSDMLSQEEIDALLSGNANTPSDNDGIDEGFTDDEKDVIGEVGNISMGTAATTLSTLLGQKVKITTPRVSVLTFEEIAQEYPLPFVAVDVKYKEGLEGVNLLILREKDVKIITDLMMGGEGVASEEPLSELHLSAIGEAMNQMVGSSSTSLSEMFGKKIDISPPHAFTLDLTSDVNAPEFIEHFQSPDKNFVRIAFRMVIGELIDSEIMQLIPLDFAKEITSTLLRGAQYTEEMPSEEIPNERMHTEPIAHANSEENRITQEKSNQQPHLSDHDAPVQQRQQPSLENSKINVQPVQFQSFDQQSNRGLPENIALIQDVPLSVTVELGRTVKKISEVLEFGPGTIIELEKVVGEPLDILVNGQYVAKGEVVVIDENYGIRITDIVAPAKRLSKI